MLASPVLAQLTESAPSAEVAAAEPSGKPQTPAEVETLRAQLLERYVDADPAALKELGQALDALKEELAVAARDFPVGDLPGLPTTVSRALTVVEKRRLLRAERDLLRDTVERLPAPSMPADTDTLSSTIQSLSAQTRNHEAKRLRQDLLAADASLTAVNAFLDEAALQLKPGKDEVKGWTQTAANTVEDLDPASWSGLQSVNDVAQAAGKLLQRLSLTEAEIALRVAEQTTEPNLSRASMKALLPAVDELERAYARADRRLTLIADSSDRRTVQTVQRDLPKLRSQLRQVDEKVAALRWLVAAESQIWEQQTPFWERRLANLGSFWSSISSTSREALSYPLFEVGNAAITLGGTLRVIAILLAAWLLSHWFRRALERYGQRRPDVSRPALYAAGRIAHYLMIVLGFSVALAAIGLDLTKIAIFASALGVGIGFGLQTVVNNFISGLILLFERSLKIGDFVELESGVTGEVTDISIRATRVTTNDNIDILVPNSEFVNGRVTSWTLREITRRVRIPFGVAYGVDKELVKKAALEAAAGVPFTFATSGPRRAQVWLVGFGDSSLDFELVVWLTADAVKRPGAVQAAYYWALEDALRAYGIEIPFPQRDLHVRSLFGTQQDEARSLWQGRAKPPKAAKEPKRDATLSKTERRELGGNDALDDALAELPKSKDPEPDPSTRS
ncbi:MAG: mechanosensitive ion channel domain-containing protein [Lysobacterales bacterium]